MSRHLIIGIDPGHTVGVAALDLSGRLLHTAHLEAGGLSGAVSLIESWGTPSLIATDVRPAPEMALKLASSFNVPLFVPQRPWREDDKRAALKEILERMKRPAPGTPSDSFALLSPGSRASSIAENAHERDALSAAIAAWRDEQNLLRKAEGENLPSAQKERFKHLLLQGYRHDFALQKIREESEPAIVHAPEPSSRPRQTASAIPSIHLLSSERQSAELRKRVAFLEHEREGLLHRIRLLENGVAERMLHDRTLRTMQAQITRLQLSLHQTYARLSGQKSKQARQVEKSESSPSRLARLQPKSFPGRPSQPPKPSTHPAAHPSGVSEDADDPPPLKTSDESPLLEKLVSEYRRGRRS